MFKASRFMFDLRSKHDMDFLAFQKHFHKQVRNWRNWLRYKRECGTGMRQKHERMWQRISEISKNEEVVVSAVANHQQWNAIMKQKLRMFAIYQVTTSLQWTKWRQWMCCSGALQSLDSLTCWSGDNTHNLNPRCYFCQFHEDMPRCRTCTTLSLLWVPPFHQ